VQRNTLIDTNGDLKTSDETFTVSMQFLCLTVQYACEDGTGKTTCEAGETKRSLPAALMLQSDAASLRMHALCAQLAPALWETRIHKLSTSCPQGVLTASTVTSCGWLYMTARRTSSDASEVFVFACYGLYTTVQVMQSTLYSQLLDAACKHGSAARSNHH
jgi:hypothetical protein